MPPEQAGFEVGRGTREQILNIYMLIEKSRTNDAIPYGVRYDVQLRPIEKTFPNAEKDGRTYSAIQRQWKVHGKVSDRAGILSPQLFNIYGSTS